MSALPTGTVTFLFTDIEGPTRLLHELGPRYVEAPAPALEEELPVRVEEALGELAAAAREGLLALSVGVGLGVLAELMEEEVVGVVRAKGKHDRERVAVRHGHEAAQ